LIKIERSCRAWRGVLRQEVQGVSMRPIKRDQHHVAPERSRQVAPDPGLAHHKQSGNSPNAFSRFSPLVSILPPAYRASAPTPCSRLSRRPAPRRATCRRRTATCRCLPRRRRGDDAAVVEPALVGTLHYVQRDRLQLLKRDMISRRRKPVEQPHLCPASARQYRPTGSGQAEEPGFREDVTHAKLDNCAVAGALDDAPVMHSNCRIDQVAPKGAEPRKDASSSAPASRE
jgi:hypothetical protein